MVVMVALLSLFSSSGANANGTLAWSPPESPTYEFIQDISVDQSYSTTAWKSQVYIGNRKMFAIGLLSNNDGSKKAEFMAYFDEGFSHVGIPGNSCKSDISRSSNLDSILSCTIPVAISFPAKFNLSITREFVGEFYSRWSGYISTRPGGDKVKIGTFDVANPRAQITSVLQYYYPIWMTNCVSYAPQQTAIFWQPQSSNGKYKFDRLIDNKCGPFKFITPLNSFVDGISVTLLAQNEASQNYRYSINEVLYPDVWNSAYDLGFSNSNRENEMKLTDIRSQLEAQIAILSGKIEVLSESNSELMKMAERTISCTSGKKKKTVTGIRPTCPSGWKMAK